MKSKEALEDIILYLNANEPKGLYCENIEVIKQELERLEKLEKENQELKDTNMKYAKLIDDFQTKNMRLKKALEIIKKKNVNIGLVNVLGSVEQYNQTYVYDNMLNVKWCLTPQEFDLLEDILEE